MIYTWYVREALSLFRSTPLRPRPKPVIKPPLRCVCNHARLHARSHSFPFTNWRIITYKPNSPIMKKNMKNWAVSQQLGYCETKWRTRSGHRRSKNSQSCLLSSTLYLLLRLIIDAPVNTDLPWSWCRLAFSLSDLQARNLIMQRLCELEGLEALVSQEKICLAHDHRVYPLLAKRSQRPQYV